MLGDPVEHSLSPRIQAAALRSAGVDGIYEARRVDTAGMTQAVAEVRQGILTGANVTMSHKRLAWDLVDRHLGSAGRVGAVNTLVRDDGRVGGANTDIDGVRFAWERAGLQWSAPVLVLGAGGAAAAALLATEGRSERVMISARRSERANRLVEQLGMHAVSVIPWGDLDPVPAGAIVVNATPLGMQGERLPSGLVARAGGLFEMAYGSGDSPALQDAYSRQLRIAGPIDMLIGQAAASFELWLDRTADVDAMYAALGAHDAET